jgi:hypothetical protein
MLQQHNPPKLKDSERDTAGQDLDQGSRGLLVVQVPARGAEGQSGCQQKKKKKK